MNIPWKFKSKVFRLLDKFPSGRLVFWFHKHLTKRAKKKVRAFSQSSAHPNWVFHAKNLEKYHCLSNIFEFGAGNHLAQNLYLSSLVEKQWLFDLNYMLDLDLVTTAIESLHSNKLLDKRLNIRSDKDLEKYGIYYRAPADARRTGLAQGSIDACISTNTLEHIPLEELEKIFLEVYRVLKIGGICSIKIDYSDHYSHTDRSISELNFLRYSQTEWESFNHSNHYQNRLRHSDYLVLFRSTNFEIIEESFVVCEDQILFEPDQSFLNSPNWNAISGKFILKKN
ncbi:hypothetical protein IMCC14465_04940 [alpha proteobacterium IMCC14465]|uniref:Methyltransferase type 11 domain-containing protein n=1 Tax=alpha proteobacterium IMCC14465 TaxID=1220535 RepID=J9A6X1_9PROT|nr:hypothetical protein IMCC14465_04940 [alpha proteobacterium IMCC14465]